MTTPHGILFVKQRLSDAPDLATLRNVWCGLGLEYRLHPDVIDHKDRLKAQYEDKVT